MSKFGWSLPPGVTNRMIEEAAGGDPEAEAFEVAFYEEFERIFGKAFVENDEAGFIDQLSQWVWKQLGNAYQRGYKQGQDDELFAQHMKTEKDTETDTWDR